MAKNKLDFTLGFTLDKKGIVDARSEISKLIQEIESHKDFDIDEELKSAKQSAIALREALTSAYNVNLEKLGVDDFIRDLKKAGYTVEGIEKELTDLGVKGANAFNAIGYEIDKVGLSVRESNKLLNEMFDTFGKTVKWGIASSIMHQMAGSVQRAVGFTKALDESLNNIRVVSGKNTEQMEAFSEEANNAAKALGKTTTEYTDASLIFFQQGKAAEEVKKLTEATLLGANVTGTDVAEMADLLTAVMNGYNVEASRALEITDKLAAVGAATGSDFEELAIGMSKVASMASVAGVNIDQLNAMLATVTTVTREAPESIGTSFKTIFGRISEVKAGKADEEGWDLGKVEEAFQKASLTVLDLEGNMKDVGDIIEEVGSKWGGFDRETKMALANAMAGQRQANRLIALFENWGMYMDTVTTSQESLGATMEQNAIREESLAYQSKQLAANLESLWMNILDEEVLRTGMSLVNTLINGANTFIESLGGMSGAIIVLGGVAASVFSTQVGKSIIGGIDKAKDFGRELQKIRLAKERSKGEKTPESKMYAEKGTGTTISEDYLLTQQTRAMEMADAELKIKKYLTAEEHSRYKEMAKIVNTEGEALTAAQNRLKVAKSLAEQAGISEDETIKAETFKAAKADYGKEIAELKRTKEIADSLVLTNRQRTISQDQLVKLLEAENISYSETIKSMDVGKSKKLKIASIEEDINFALAIRKEQLEAIDVLEKKGLANAEKEAIALEKKSGKKIKGAEEEISKLEKAASRQQMIENVVSYGAAATTAIGGLVAAMNAYKKAGNDIEKQNDAMAAGMNSVGTALLLMPHPYLKIAGAVTIATTALVKWIKENTGMEKIIKRNRETLENYKKTISEIKQQQDGLTQSTNKMAQAEALAKDGLAPDEVEEYKNIIADIASTTPEVVAYYDAFGNAVLKSREEVDKLNESLKQQELNLHGAMEAQAGSFASEIAYLQRSGRQEEETLNAKLKKQVDELNEAYASGSTKKIQEAKDSIAETTQELDNLKKQFSELGTKAQEAIVNPFIQSEEVFKRVGENLQGYIGTIFTSTAIQKGLEDIAKDASLTTDQLQARSDDYLNSYKKGVLKLGTAFASLTESQDESSRKLVENLGNLPQDVQAAISQQLITVSVGLDDEQVLAEVQGLADYIDEQGNLDTFRMVSYFRDKVGPEARNSLAKNITQGIIDGINDADLEKALELKSWKFGETLGKNIAEAIKEESGRSVGSYDDGGEPIDIYTEEEQLALNTIAEAFTKGKTELIKALSEATPEMLEIVEESIADIDGSLIGSDKYKEALEAVREIIASTQEQKYELDSINAALEDQDDIYSDLAGTMAESIDGQQEIVELWNTMVEQTQAVGEGGLFSVDIDALDEQLSEAVEIMGETGAAQEDLIANSEQLRESSINVGTAFETMIANMGEDSFAKMAELTGKTTEELKKLANEAKDGSVEAAKALQKEMAKVYAGLKKEDHAYFNDFKKINKDRLLYLEDVTGLSADKYDNLAQYSAALEEWKTNKYKEYSRWQYDQLVQTLKDKGDAELKSSEYSMDIAEGSLDGVGRAAALSALALAKNAAEAAKAAGQSGSEAAANMITALSAVDKGSSTVLLGMADEIRKKGKNVDDVIQYINSKIAEIQAGASSGTGDDIIIEGIKLPSFDDFNYVTPPGALPMPGYTPTGGGTDTGGDKFGDGGGGDSGGGGGSEKEVEDLEWIEDIYHDINIQLEQNSQLLDRLKKQQDKLYGKELLDNLAQQKQALIDQQKLLERKLEMQKQDLEQQKGILAQQGVQFNVDNTISNYNKLLKEKLAYVNSLSGEAKEAAKEEFEKLVSLMESYEEMLMNSITNTENAIQDAIDAQREIFLQEFEYAIQLKIEISTDLEKALDFAKEMNKEFEDYSDNYERIKQQMAEQLDLAGRLKDKLTEINNNPDLTEKERLELLEKYNKELQDATKTLKKLDEELTKVFKDTLKDGLDMVKEHLNEFKNLNDQLKHYEQTLKLIGEGENFAVLDTIYEAQYSNIMGQISALNSQMSALAAQKAALEAAGMTGTDEWKAVDEAIKQTQKDLNSLAQESLKLLQTEFKNSVDEILATLENAMTQGQGLTELKKQHQDLKDERKQYLDGEEKLLAVSKLQQKVQKEIDETEDPAKKAELQKFMDTELKNLKEKDKLTKYDVDRANLVYDLTLKQMALDDQRATKNIMRLVRDTQGNWVYEFTEDAKAIEKAQEDVSSAMEKLMELDKKKLEETQDLMLKLQEEYYKEIQQLANDAASGKITTEEELRQKLQEVTDKYNQKMQEANATYEEVKTNATLSSMAVILKSYMETGDSLGNLTAEQEQLLKNLADATGGSYLEMTDIVKDLISGDEDSVLKAMKELGYTTKEEMDSAHNAVSGLITDMQSQWGTSVTDMISQFIGSGGFKESSNLAIESIIGKWNEYQTKVDEVQKETGLDLDTIKDKIGNVDEATKNLNTTTEQIIGKFKEEMDAVTELTKAYKDSRDEIRKNIDELVKYIDTINQAIDAIKRKHDTEANPPKPPAPTPPPTTGGGGSGGGSGSGGKPTPPGMGASIKVKTGRRWYYDSYGTNPSGPTDPYADRNLYVVNTSNNKYKYAVGTTQSVNSALGWLREEDLVGFRSGGYTGNWGDDGKLGILHEKELILNKGDTENMLEAIKLTKGTQDGLFTSIAKQILETSRKSLEVFDRLGKAISVSGNFGKATTQTIEQNITIEADFSGVKSSQEIEKAFENMANMASQYANRKK